MRVRGSVAITERGRLAPALLIGAGAASAVLLLVLGSGFTFFHDEWGLLLHRRGLDADAFLAPHNEHLMLIPTAVYKALQTTFGMESTLPYRVVATSVLLLTALLLFVYLRRAVGDWPALLATVVVLFLGAAWEILLWPINIGFSCSMAAGLGMLLALRRGDRIGDMLASGLLAVSIAASSLGLVFAAGAAVEIVLCGERRLRRAFVVAVPLALFALWYAGWGHAAESAISLENALTTPRFVVEGIASSVAALLGMFAVKDAVSEQLRLAGALLLTAGALVTVVWLARTGRLRGRTERLSHGFWTVAVVTLAFWLIAGLNEIPGRTPSASRYLYPGAIFLLLLAGEYFRGARVARPAAAALAVVAAVSLVGNTKALADGKRFLQRETDLASAELGAMEIARERIDPWFKPVHVPIGSQRLSNVDAASYLSAVDAFGSPADDPGELSERPGDARAAADVVLAQAVGVRFDPQAAAGSDRIPRPNGTVCTVVEGGADPDSAGARLPYGRMLLRAAPDAPFPVRIRRFATEVFPVPLGQIPAGSDAVLRLPPDGAQQGSWEIVLEPSHELRCVP